MKGGPQGTDGPKVRLAEPDPMLRDWDGSTPSALIEELRRRLGDEITQRTGLEQLMVEITEALRPLRKASPHAIVDTYTKAAISAMRALDAYTRERSPDVVHIQQEFREANPAQAMGAPSESPEEFYKRTAQRLREELELELAKVVDLGRELELEREQKRFLVDRVDKLEHLLQTERETAAQARNALREMAKLL